MEVGPVTINKLMGQYGLGRSALARMLGATVTMVWKWETNKAKPTGPARRLIQYLAEGRLNVDPREFLKKIGRPSYEDA